MGDVVGYARTSTLDQVAGFEAQIRDLEAVGVTKLYQEQVSSVGDREQLEKALDYVREGDTFVVTKLDRLARSTAHLLQIVETLKSKGVTLRILDMQLDTSTPQGRMMLTVMGSMAQFEREMMLERQREGIARAKSEGKYKGRKPLDQAKVDQIKAFKADGIGASEIAKRVGVGRATVYRILADK